jgi:hypothetical protein
MLYALGTSANLEVLMNALNRLLYFSGSVETVSRRWAKKWIARNTDFFKTVRSKLIAVQRRNAHIIEDIEGHFTEFDRCKKH